MKAPHLLHGAAAERMAQSWLRRQGLQSIAHNYRCKFGELDLIMRDSEQLVIVEVRYRRSSAYGGALGSVTSIKLERISQAILHFLQHHPRWSDWPVRLDVLSLSGDLQRPEYDWRRGIFLDPA